MKTVCIEKYRCEVCGAEYDSIEHARDCEKIPIMMNKCVHTGDMVEITRGEGVGNVVKVKQVKILKPGEVPRQYWHTVAVVVEWEGWTRLLTFESYI